MLKNSAERLYRAFQSGNKELFLSELESVKARSQLNDREIYNTIKVKVLKEDWGLLKSWIKSDMSDK